MADRVRTARRLTLRTAGTVALGAAAHQIATGVGGVRGVRPGDVDAIPPDVDSELRFYATWYAAAGVLMHRAASSATLDRQITPVVTGAWALAACSRLLSLRTAGRPSGLFLVLTGVELAVAGLLAATGRHDDEPRCDGAPA